MDRARIEEGGEANSPVGLFASFLVAAALTASYYGADIKGAWDAVVSTIAPVVGSIAGTESAPIPPRVK